MNENNILDVFYKLLDDKKFDDIDKFETVEKAHSFLDMLFKRYKRIFNNKELYYNEFVKDSGNIEIIQDTEIELSNLKSQWQQVDKLRGLIDGAFFDIQEYYFMQGFKANTELREQLKRLLDNKESESVKNE